MHINVIGTFCGRRSENTGRLRSNKMCSDLRTCAQIDFEEILWNITQGSMKPIQCSTILKNQAGIIYFGNDKSADNIFVPCSWNNVILLLYNRQTIADKTSIRIKT